MREVNDPTAAGPAHSWLEENRGAIEQALPGYLPARRWFGGKARRIAATRLVETVPLGEVAAGPYLALVRVEYSDGSPDLYLLPLALAGGGRAAGVQSTTPQAVVVRPGEASGDTERVIYDASWDAPFALLLLEAIEGGRRLSGGSGEVVAWRTDAFELAVPGEEPVEASIMGVEQSNTSVRYGDRFILKMYRRLEEGLNPDLELGLYLTEQRFKHTPPLAGAIEYRADGREPVALAILQGYVPNRGDAWVYTLISLDGYLNRASQLELNASELLPQDRHPLDLVETSPPGRMVEALGEYLTSARLLGRRTAELHLALSSEAGAADPDFAAEPFSPGYQRSLYDAIQGLARHAFDLLDRNLEKLPPEAQAGAGEVLANRSALSERFSPLLASEMSALRTRTHGDYHLGQVLYTGSDFSIIDFEGEPVRSLEERRRKHSPLRDVAGMLRSFHYAANSALFARAARDGERRSQLEGWVAAWHAWVGAAFLGEYLATASRGPFLPRSRDELRTLLDTFLLEKAIYELIYELNNRPDWVAIPIEGILQLTTDAA